MRVRDLILQRPHGIDPRGARRRHEASSQRHEQHHDESRAERPRITRAHSIKQVSPQASQGERNNRPKQNATGINMPLLIPVPDGSGKPVRTIDGLEFQTFDGLELLVNVFRINKNFAAGSSTEGAAGNSYPRFQKTA